MTELSPEEREIVERFENAPDAFADDRCACCSNLRRLWGSYCVVCVASGRAFDHQRRGA